MMGQEKNMFFHNAWRNVIGGFLIMALLHSMLQTCFSLFLLPVTGDMHISTTAFSGCSSIVAIASMFAAPKIGKLMEHSKIIKKLMILCIIGMGLSYASYSLATSIIHMYISAVFLGIFSCGATILPITIILTKWFYERRGLAVGITLSGSGIGGSIIFPFLTEFIATHGWRNSFVLFGFLMIIIEIPVVCFIMAPDPAEIGCIPYGYHADSPKSSSTDKLSFSELKEHSFFYVYLIGIFSICVAGYGSLGFLSASLSESYSPALAHAIIPFFLFLLTPAKILLGWMYDRIRTRAGTIYVTVTFAMAFILLQIPDDEQLMWIMSILFAFGISSGTVSPSFITGELFGTKEFGILFGFVYAVCMGAMAVANPLLAAINDLTSSYNLAWSACMTLCLLSGVCIYYAYISYKNLLKKRQKETA